MKQQQIERLWITCVNIFRLRVLLVHAFEATRWDKQPPHTHERGEKKTIDDTDNVV